MEDDQKEKDGKGIRAELERGVEIENASSRIFSDLRSRPEIPVAVFRTLIRNSKPRLIGIGVSVAEILHVYGIKNRQQISHDAYKVKHEPLIVFKGKDGFIYIWHRDSLIFTRPCEYKLVPLVGKDGVVDCMIINGETDNIEYYHILPDKSIFRNTRASGSGAIAKNTFTATFFNEHGGEKEWGTTHGIYENSNTCDNLDSMLRKDAIAQCISGPIDDYQIAIIRCGTKIYKVILGYAEDFNQGK